jgi:hypothetical protein
MEARIDRTSSLAHDAEQLAARLGHHVTKISGPRPTPAADRPSGQPAQAGPIGIIDSLDYHLHRIDMALKEINEHENVLDSLI